LVYPWDCLLLESGFAALFLPAPNALPDWSASALPLPAVAWAQRWLLFRVVLGFGKLKFLGINRKELGFLKSFFIAVPLPGPLAFHAHRLPGWFLKLSLLGLFLVEVLAPFLIFVPGYPRLVAALAITGLMLAIGATGNYGHFNVLVIVLCLPLLDLDASLFDQPLSGVVWPLRNLLAHAVVLVLFVGGLLYFHSSSWCSQAWIWWPSLLKGRARWIAGLLAFYRLLAPFRILHAYGVFPASCCLPARAVPVLEGTQDGQTWKEYPYRYLMSGLLSGPVWVAPHTPRHDHNLFYEASGTDVTNFLASTFAIGNPYLFSRASGLERVIQRLLEGSSSVASLFASNPFPDGPPKAIRVSLYLLQPTSPEERRRTGAWWRRQYLAPHLPAVTLDRTVWDEWLPDPELFHPDELIWKLRAPRIRSLFERARRGDLKAAVLEPSAGITAEVLDLFWSRLVAEARPEERGDWSNLGTVVRRLRQPFNRAQLRHFERILGRLSLALYARLEPYYLGDREPRIELETLFEVGMLVSHIIAEGRETYEAVFHDPARAASLVPAMTAQTGLFLTAMFWYDKLVYQARKFRMLRRYFALDHRPGLPGFVKLIPFLAQQFEVPGEEHYPNFVRRISDGEWILIEPDEAPR
jgi:hypothetical protein